MKITNLSRNLILADNAALADTAIKRMRGLIGRSALNAGEALIIRPCPSVHTFFMRFAIDVLFVDKGDKIIKAIPAIKPFKLSGIYFNSAFAVELPAGIIQATSTQVGDLISID